MARMAPVAASMTITAPCPAAAALPAPSSIASSRASTTPCRRLSSVVRRMASAPCGTIVSDWQAISQMVGRHHVAKDAADAARQALAATVDVELPDVETYHTLVAQVKQGTVPEAAINDAVWSIHFCMKPDHMARSSELVATASVAARASAGREWKATKNALIPLRHTRRGSVGSRCAAPSNSASARAITGSSNDSSTASFDLK